TRCNTSATIGGTLTALDGASPASYAGVDGGDCDARNRRRPTARVRPHRRSRRTLRRDPRSARRAGQPAVPGEVRGQRRTADVPWFGLSGRNTPEVTAGGQDHSVGGMAPGHVKVEPVGGR